MSEALEPSAADVERAVNLVRAHEHGAALAALAFDLVSRQAEGRVLFTGERFVAARAEEHSVDVRIAETPLGNLLSILERGPETAAHWALLSALHVRGFADAWQARGDADARKALVARFAAHAEWLEASTWHRPFEHARHLLPEALSTELCRQLAASIVRETREARHAQGLVPNAEFAGFPAALRGRNAVRIGALALVRYDSAKTALETIRNDSEDDFARALARVVLAGRLDETKPVVAAEAVGPEATVVRIGGVLSRAPRATGWSFLRWLSGYALVRWLIAGFAALLGVRRHALVELQGQSLCLRIATRWLGRTVRSADEVLGLSHVEAVRRVARYASLHLMVGVTLFAAGVLAGGYMLGDALRTHDRTLLLAGASLVLGGAGLDLLLSVLVPAAARRVRVELDLGARGRVHIAGVPAADADAFMHALLEERATPSARARH